MRMNLVGHALSIWIFSRPVVRPKCYLMHGLNPVLHITACTSSGEFVVQLDYIPSEKGSKWHETGPDRTWKVVGDAGSRIRTFLTSRLDISVGGSDSGGRARRSARFRLAVDPGMIALLLPDHSSILVLVLHLLHHSETIILSQGGYRVCICFSMIKEF